MSSTPTLQTTIRQIEIKLAEDAEAEKEADRTRRAANIATAYDWLVNVITAIQDDIDERFGLWTYGVYVDEYCGDDAWGDAAMEWVDEWATGIWPTAIMIGCDIGAKESLIYLIGPKDRTLGDQLSLKSWMIETVFLGGPDNNVTNAAELLERLRSEAEEF